MVSGGAAVLFGHVGELFVGEGLLGVGVFVLEHGGEGGHAVEVLGVVGGGGGGGVVGEEGEPGGGVAAGGGAVAGGEVG
ncbi:hypothetical protein, partial [Streptomyces zaomyceticus]|uniref:hypothetical protein n=1 Tax=Streptomyces zaomyceticus TaxID=68286 RepID=UPI0036BA87E4